MKTLALGALAVIAVAALATSKGLFNYLRTALMRKRADEGMMDDDIQRFVNEGGTPVGAGAE